MKAIVINVMEPSLKTVDMPEGDTLKFQQEIVGGFIEAAHYFENGDCLMVNEEGLYLPIDKWQVWDFQNKPPFRAFKGNGIIVGTGEEGDTISCKSSIDDIKKMVNPSNEGAVALMAQMGSIV